MGDVADDIVDGACCEDCNTYFVAEHGHPVLCVECWRQTYPNEAERIDVLWRRAVHAEA